MSGKKVYNFDEYLSEAQKGVKEFALEKEQLNSKLKNYIISFQSFDSEINKSLFDAREFYYEKRYKYDQQIKKLLNKKHESERLWRHFDKKIESLQKPKFDENALILLDYTKKSLGIIENKIINMNQTIEEQILDIEEENEITEQIRELESEKQKKINILAELEQKQIIKFQSSDYYKIKTKIKDIEKELGEIYEDLFILSNKRLMTHRNWLDLYKKAKEFEKIKKKIENELIDNRITAEGYHELFLKLMALNRKVLLDELSNKSKIEMRPWKKKKPDVKAIIKKKKKYKKLEQKKLEIALEKQKSGKKLDFYEYQLILKHSKK
ncbi:MAG: hypothetical protein ACFFFT_17910 [Candidatus Thorarchaeota archaeon]